MLLFFGQGGSGGSSIVIEPGRLVAKLALRLDSLLAERWVQAALFFGALALFFLVGARPAYS